MDNFTRVNNAIKYTRWHLSGYPSQVVSSFTEFVYVARYTTTHLACFCYSNLTPLQHASGYSLWDCWKLYETLWNRVKFTTLQLKTNGTVSAQKANTLYLHFMFRLPCGFSNSKTTIKNLSCIIFKFCQFQGIDEVFRFHNSYPKSFQGITKNI